MSSGALFITFSDLGWGGGGISTGLDGGDGSLEVGFVLGSSVTFLSGLSCLPSSGSMGLGSLFLGLGLILFFSFSGKGGRSTFSNASISSEVSCKAGSFSFDSSAIGGDVGVAILCPVNKSWAGTPLLNRISDIFSPLSSHSVHTPCSRLFLKL